MSKLNVDQKSIKDLLEYKKADFLIPDYQRPYAWEEKECQTLWDDIFSFAFPDNDYSKFDRDNDEYYLGPIVTFKNEDGKQEVIDGQQRLTTIMLLLRSFYDMFLNMKDDGSRNIRETIERCLWKTGELGEIDKEALKISSEVATENDNEEFRAILRDGVATKEQNSKYAQNFRFFQKKIEGFLKEYPSYFQYLPSRILQNCILLPIEAESQDTALRIFSTLNDRGKPLSDADIFKAQFYKFFSKIGKKDDFVATWKMLEEMCQGIFHTSASASMDELFTRYMYFERAKSGNKSSTTEALRKFYERNGYEVLKSEETFNNLTLLAKFWSDVSNQNKEVFSERVLRRLFVLNYAPNGMWTYFVSVYYMQNKDAENKLDEGKFYDFLNKITAFIWAYAFTNPGLNALRTPVYAEMVNLVSGKPVEFNDYKFDADMLLKILNDYNFSNIRPITKSMLAWWAFDNKEYQSLLSLETVFEIEHIYARKRYEKEKSLSSKALLESLGNKSLLEKTVNIRATDYRLVDKKQYYDGFITSNKQYKKGTDIAELKEIALKADFLESDIEARKKKIFSSFIDFLKRNDLIKQ